MGGSRTRNRIDNVAWVCVRHHDVLDGRTGLGILRVELNETLRRSDAPWTGMVPMMSRPHKRIVFECPTCGFVSVQIIVLSMKTPQCSAFTLTNIQTRRLES